MISSPTPTAIERRRGGEAGDGPLGIADQPAQEEDAPVAARHATEGSLPQVGRHDKKVELIETTLRKRLRFCNGITYIGGVSKWDKLIFQILSGNADAAIPFDDLCNLLERLGFERRTRGSHNIFRLAGVEEKPNLQRDGKSAKPYQVRQVRDIIVKYKLAGDS